MRSLNLEGFLPMRLFHFVLKCVDSYRIQSRAASRWAVAKKETAVFS